MNRASAWLVTLPGIGFVSSISGATMSPFGSVVNRACAVLVSPTPSATVAARVTT